MGKAKDCNGCAGSLVAETKPEKVHPNLKKKKTIINNQKLSVVLSCS